MKVVGAVPGNSGLRGVVGMVSLVHVMFMNPMIPALRLQFWFVGGNTMVTTTPTVTMMMTAMVSKIELLTMNLGKHLLVPRLHDSHGTCNAASPLECVVDL